MIVLAHSDPCADVRYRCLVCDARWPFAQVRHGARCRDCGGALERVEPPEGPVRITRADSAGRTICEGS